MDEEEMPPDAPPPEPVVVVPAHWTPDVIVEKYVALRDKKKALQDDLKARIKPIDAVLDALEGRLLQQLQAAGSDSFKTRNGTAYTTTRTDVVITSWSDALGYIQEKEAWEMLERRVSKTAVEAIMKETEQPVPGVALRREIVVNVRRPAGKLEE